MFIEDIKIGMKVVPISKTIILNNGEPSVRPANSSVAYRAALSEGQEYLYVVAVDIRRERILCNIREARGGDYFKEYDLEPWVENS